jgi:signal transduction histidine kinase
MKEHNGSVEAANAPGGGAVFTVTLPAATSVSKGVSS